MKEEINIKIDTKPIVENIITDNGLKDEVERTLKSMIVNEVAHEIRERLDTTELKEKSLYSRDYLTRTAKEILDKELRSLIEEYTQTYLKDIGWQIRRIVNDEIESIALPKIRKFVENIVVLDGEREKELMEEQQAEYEANQDN